MDKGDRLIRTEMLIGAEGIERLSQAKVIVFGAGGVGGYVIEALARCGVGGIDIVDNDVISVSNINRQIFALTSTVGKLKTEVAKARIFDINQDITVNTVNKFILPENINEIDLSVYNYVIDAVDTVAAKIAIIQAAKAAGIPIISSMGTGNKLDPSCFETCDISKTTVCPLARVMRKELKSRGISGVKVLYSKEEPIAVRNGEAKGTVGRTAPGSIAFVPSTAGMMISAEVIKELLAKGENDNGR